MILVEKATSNDIPTIQDIAYDTWPSTFAEILSKQQIEYMLEMMYSTPSLLEQIQIKKHHFFLAKEDEVALGFISVELNYQNQATAKIHKIYILPATQGKGIGKILMHRVEELAQEYSQKSITLNVNRFNKALSFYQKLGYTIAATENIEIGNGYLMEDFVLEKEL
jgi:ribosomal protein S18 acetylase RimI-like enzyme